MSTVKVPEQISIPISWDVARGKLNALLAEHSRVINLKIQAGSWSTGAKSATFSATNKPGSNDKTSPDKWLALTDTDGTVYYIPGFLA